MEVSTLMFHQLEAMVEVEVSTSMSMTAVETVIVMCSGRKVLMNALYLLQEWYNAGIVAIAVRRVDVQHGRGLRDSLLVV